MVMQNINMINVSFQQKESPQLSRVACSSHKKSKDRHTHTEETAEALTPLPVFQNKLFNHSNLTCKTAFALTST